MSWRKPTLETSEKRRWGRLKEVGRFLRAEQTPAEGALWSRLRAGKLGVRFRRQHAVDRFVVDFYCPAAALVVEVDGSVHKERSTADREREQRLRAMGLRILRFPNERVESSLDDVVAEIAAAIRARSDAPRRS